MRNHRSRSRVALPAGWRPFREPTRAPLEAPVRLKFDSTGPMQEGFSANVSQGGMFVRGAKTHPVGSLVKFELELSPSSPLVVGLGEVVWIRLEQVQTGQPPGMGIQFKYLDADSVSRLDAAVRKAAMGSLFPRRRRLLGSA